MTAEKQDIYQTITNQIISAIESGKATYKMPWHKMSADSFAPVNAASKKHYRGVNVLSLWAAADHRGYPTGFWATYKQWQELGAQVRSGEKSALVVFWKTKDLEEEDASEGEEKKAGRCAVFARGYSVFNAAQVDGWTAPQPEENTKNARIEHAESFFSRIGADIRHGGNRACYSPVTDHIQMPEFFAFTDPVSYYSVLSHESTHWSGAAGRLNRQLANRFGDEAYALEELIAELSAAFLCSSLYLSNTPRADHAGYVASWLKVLKDDKRAIFTAASKAQQAVDWLEQQAARAGERAAA